VLCRPTSNRSGLESMVSRFHVADLGDAEAMGRALHSARAHADSESLQVVHNAALISYARRDRTRLQVANVEGVRNLLEASLAAGVQRIVHVSSIVTSGFAEGGVARVEGDECNARSLAVDYVETKLAGEGLVLDAPDSLNVRVVQPGAIFGPVEAGSNSARFLVGMAQGKIGALAPPGGMAVVGVRDCARGVRLALERGRSGERYLLTESYLSNRELFREVGLRLVGRDPVRAVVPRPLWRCLGAAVRALSIVHEPKFTTPQAMRMLGVEFNASGGRARRELGWDPKPFGQVLDWTLGEMRRRGLLPSR
ncbi:MAG: SDR family oxidoreductase, partial [Planctomycetes bacterium]|nr:SDR family oxidoreductase [Planctomycetota bacterium]